MTLVLFSVFFILLAFGVPIALALILSSVIPLYHTGMPLIVIPQKIFASFDSYGLMAIPFFMMAGGLLDKGGVSKRLVNFANSLVGWLPGGLAIVVFLASAFFGAISGSAAATVAAMGSILVPAMLEEGYPLKFTLATVAIAGVLGIIVPPSIPMVIYGLSASVSIGEVFMGGFLPGFMLAAGMSVYSLWYGKKHLNVARSFSLREVWVTFADAIWALIMPFIILGGIYGGVFTPTEASSVACLYGLFVGVFVYREINFDIIKDILRGAVTTTAMLFFVIAGATVFGLIMTREMIPMQVAEWILGVSKSQAGFLVLVTILLLVVGTFMDVVPAVVILTPIFVPVLKEYDVNPVAFGVIMIITLGIGLVTPPVGLNLYVAAGLRKTTIENVFGKDLLVYILAALGVLVVLMAVPQIIMFLPDMMAKGA
ncbi:MAG: TRAP transporter large permease [Planctomycetota bacterium]|jgi:C4-dicarboxylate transporter DctM subunit|nr:TRAP transporter large permease [Planctomycetota bacterium]